jgi:hypothetical protein
MQRPNDELKGSENTKDIKPAKVKSYSWTVEPEEVLLVGRQLDPAIHQWFTN